MIDTIAVVIPAANEAGLIANCLQSLQIAAGQVECRVHVVVVLDSCTDDTERITRQFTGVDIVAVQSRNVGQVRRTGAAAALTGLDPAHTLLASTDADSVVPPTWLAHVRSCAEHADLVLGTVVPGLGMTPIVEADWYARHSLIDGHPHVHAANLAMRADAYLALGGWHPLTTGEDEDLVRRATSAGLRILRTAFAPVLTSVRTTGRVAKGFSSYIRTLGHVEAS